MAELFDIEAVVEALFDEVYPTDSRAEHPSCRAVKPFLESALGALASPAQETRALLPGREFYKFDAWDFFEYATSAGVGPQFVESFRWWQIRDEEDGTIGWAVDQVAETTGLETTLSPR